MKPLIDVVIGLILQDGKVLVCQRPAGVPFPGRWEFPGGKRQEGESLETCLARELREELGVGVRPVANLVPIEHEYTSTRVRLYPYVCTDADGDPRPLASQQLAWVDPPRLRDYDFPPANGRLIEQVLDYLAREPAPSCQSPAAVPAGRSKQLVL